MSNTDNTRYYIPYRVTESDFATMGISYKDTRKYKVGDKFICVYLVPNDDPELYRKCLNEFYYELLNEWRSKKCVIPDGRGGFMICKKPCGECMKQRVARFISLEFEQEINGFDPADNCDEIERLVDHIALMGLMDRLRELDPECTKVLDLLLEGLTERDAAEVLGWPRSSVHYFADKGIEKMRRLHCK